MHEYKNIWLMRVIKAINKTEENLNSANRLQSQMIKTQFEECVSIACDKMHHSRIDTCVWQMWVDVVKHLSESHDNSMRNGFVFKSF